MADSFQLVMDHAVAVARKAGEMVREALTCDRKAMIKSSAVDLVTQTDQKVEQLIIQSVMEKFPSHRFIGEESVAAGESCVLTDDPTWIIDPIDGTTNFVHTFPFVAVSIGFSVNKQTYRFECVFTLTCFDCICGLHQKCHWWCCDVSFISCSSRWAWPTPTCQICGLATPISTIFIYKQVEVGVVYSCLEDKMFTARRGRGAFCNGEPLQVSDQTDIQKSIVATEFGSNRDPDAVDKIFCSLKNVLNLPVHGVRSAGSAAINMCLVACGCVEVYYEIGIHVWDVAAGSLIVSEAGGVLMDVDGGQVDLMSRRLVAANNRDIAERLVKEIAPFSPPRDDASPLRQ